MAEQLRVQDGAPQILDQLAPVYGAVLLLEAAGVGPQEIADRLGLDIASLRSVSEIARRKLIAYLTRTSDRVEAV